MNNNTEQKFDVKEFNKGFDTMKNKIKEQNHVTDETILKKLNDSENLPKIPIYLQTPEMILFNIRKTWFDIYDDYQIYGPNIQLLDKNDRLFYLGLTILFFAFVLYAIYILFDVDDELNTKEKVVIEKHFYHKHE